MGIAAPAGSESRCFPCASVAAVSRNSVPRTSVTPATPTSARVRAAARSGSPPVVHARRSDAPLGARSSGTTLGRVVATSVGRSFVATNAAATITAIVAAAATTSTRFLWVAALPISSRTVSAGAGLPERRSRSAGTRSTAIGSETRSCVRNDS